MAQALASICSTSTPGAMRSRSGMLVALERRMSSRLITKTAAAVRARLCSLFETDVTLTFIRSSMSSLLRSMGAGSWAAPVDRNKERTQLRWATWRKRMEVAVWSITLYISADRTSLNTPAGEPGTDGAASEFPAKAAGNSWQSRQSPGGVSRRGCDAAGIICLYRDWRSHGGRTQSA